MWVVLWQMWVIWGDIVADVGSIGIYSGKCGLQREVLWQMWVVEGGVVADVGSIW